LTTQPHLLPAMHRQRLLVVRQPPAHSGVLLGCGRRILQRTTLDASCSPGSRSSNTRRVAGCLTMQLHLLPATHLLPLLQRVPPPTATTLTKELSIEHAECTPAP
jgi:hypothetical protein